MIFQLDISFCFVLFLSVGHFAFFATTERDESAQLESETMEAVDQACLEMWYHAEGWLINSESFLQCQ